MSAADVLAQHQYLDDATMCLCGAGTFNEELDMAVHQLDVLRAAGFVIFEPRPVPASVDYSASSGHCWAGGDEDEARAEKLARGGDGPW